MYGTNSNYIILSMELKQLFLYRGILNDRTLKKLLMLFDDLASGKSGPDVETVNIAYDFMADLVGKCEEMGFSGNIFSKYFLRLALCDENRFTLACESKKVSKSSSLYALAFKDLEVIHSLISFDFMEFFQTLNINCDAMLAYKPTNEAYNQFADQMVFSGVGMEQFMNQIVLYYTTMGCGILSEYKMLRYRYESDLTGIEDADDVTFDMIVGFDREKRALIENIEALINGQSSDNMLLVGSRGMGKRSCVKALANKYVDRGLRIIEIRKNADSWGHLQELLVKLRQRGKFFIIFLNDLPVDTSEAEYKQLNSLIEGGLSNRPKNVIFCATASDYARFGEDAGMERLTDKFGLTVMFKPPTLEEYMNIVAGIAKREGITVPRDILEDEAMKWFEAKFQNEYTGRSARLFIDHFKWEITR